MGLSKALAGSYVDFVCKKNDAKTVNIQLIRRDAIFETLAVAC